MPRAESPEQAVAVFRFAQNRSIADEWRCLLDTLTLNRESRAVQTRTKAALEFWIDSFARFASESCGLSSALASERAQDAVSALEGGLVIARVSK